MKIMVQALEQNVGFIDLIDSDCLYGYHHSSAQLLTTVHHCLPLLTTALHSCLIRVLLLLFRKLDLKANFCQ